MRFFRKLLGIGVVAGTTATAIKVAEKVKENNPAGMVDTDAKAVVGEVARAAADVYHETADVVKEKAPEVVDKFRDIAAGFSGHATDETTEA